MRPYTITTANPGTGKEVKLEFTATNRQEAIKIFKDRYSGWKIKKIESLRSTIATIIGCTILGGSIAGAAALNALNQPDPVTQTQQDIGNP